MPRKPKSTAEKERNGSLKHDPQRRNLLEPKPTLKKPPMPVGMKADKVAAAKWRHLCKCLDDLGVLAITDHDLMATYCYTWSRMMAAGDAIQAEGITVDGKRNPALTTVNFERAAILRMIPEMGLSPSSRTKLHAAPKEVDDPFLEYLKGNAGNN